MGVLGVTREQQDARAQRHRERKQREGITTVTWLKRPVRLVQGKRIFVTGVCSDADPAVAAEYLP